jgi:hypothetical protein
VSVERTTDSQRHAGAAWGAESSMAFQKSVQSWIGHVRECAANEALSRDEANLGAWGRNDRQMITGVHSSHFLHHPRKKYARQ